VAIYVIARRSVQQRFLPPNAENEPVRVTLNPAEVAGIVREFPRCLFRCVSHAHLEMAFGSDVKLSARGNASPCGIS
jgi:hypothetical protein